MGPPWQSGGLVWAVAAESWARRGRVMGCRSRVMGPPWQSGRVEGCRSRVMGPSW